MSDLISRQAAIDAINEQINQPISNDVTAWGLMVARDCIIAKLPSAQPEQKSGEWERNDDGIMIWWECSECHHDAWYDREELTNYCPNCGADMREPPKESETNG